MSFSFSSIFLGIFLVMKNRQIFIHHHFASTNLHTALLSTTDREIKQQNIITHLFNGSPSIQRGTTRARILFVTVGLYII